MRGCRSCACRTATRTLLHPGQTPASTALGVLGAPGMAAYFGLLDLARLRPGETVLVSAAANAAGSMAGQVAMLKGARAIGIASSREKAGWVVRHARLTACLNHAAEVSTHGCSNSPLAAWMFISITAAASCSRPWSSAATSPGAGASCRTPAPADRGAPDARRLSRREGRGAGAAARVGDYEHRRGEFLRDAIAWYGAGRIAVRDHVVEGLARARRSCCARAAGDNFGRPLVKV